MNFVLIGHRGYLGTGLFAYLSKKNHVIGWDKEEDIFKLDTALLLREKIDAVLNLSVIVDRKTPNYIVDSPTELVNVEGARHIARILKGTDIGWIQMSTREVFKLTTGPKDVTKTKNGYRPKSFNNEEFQLAPPNCYGKSKLIAEMISETHPRSNVIRLTTCYTDFDHPAGNYVVQMIKNAVHGKTVSLSNGGLQYRDPLHIDDLGHLMELLTEKKIGGEKMNVGGGKKNLISLREFIQTAVPTVKLQKMPGGDYGVSFDNRKATQLTGWIPKVMFREKIPVIVGNVTRNMNRSTPIFGPGA